MRQSGLMTEMSKMTEATALVTTGTSTRRTALRLLGVGMLSVALGGISQGEAAAKKKGKKGKKKGKNTRDSAIQGPSTTTGALASLGDISVDPSLSIEIPGFGLIGSLPDLPVPPSLPQAHSSQVSAQAYDFWSMYPLRGVHRYPGWSYEHLNGLFVYTAGDPYRRYLGTIDYYGDLYLGYVSLVGFAGMYRVLYFVRPDAQVDLIAS